MSLPPLILGPPNTVVLVQPGVNVQAVCIITPPPGAALTIGRGNVSVAVQPGVAVRAVVLVDSSGQYTTL